MTLNDIIEYVKRTEGAENRAQAVHAIREMCGGMTQQGVYNWSHGVPSHWQSFFALHSRGKLKADPPKKRRTAA